MIALTIQDGEAALSIDGVEVDRQPFDEASPEDLDAFGADQISELRLRAAMEALESRLGGMDGSILSNIAQQARGSLFLVSVSTELERLPWELVRGGAQEERLSQRHDMAMRMPGDAAMESSATPWPLRAAVMVGSEASDPRVLAEEEIKRLDIELDRGERNPSAPDWIRADVQLMRLVRETKAKATARIQAFAPHVVHFVGHGDEAFDEAEDREVFALAVQVNGGGAEKWTAKDFRSLFSGFEDGEPVPRLVVLNACGTARTLGRPDHSSLASRLGTWGVEAVVATIGPIEGQLAVAFAKALYQALRQSHRVPAAVRIARAALAAAGNQRLSAIGVPRLYLRAGIERVLPTPPADRLPLRQGLVCPVLRTTQWYSDRHDIRWAVWSRIQGGSSGITAVVGEPRVGKSALVQVVAERALLAGYECRYVDLADWAASLSWLEVLQAIRDVARSRSDVGLTRPWSQGVFDNFTHLLWDLSELFFDRAIPDEPTPRDVPSGHLRQIVPEARDQGGEDRLVVEFRRALERLAQSGPTLLVVDHLPGDPLMFPDLRRLVLRPLMDPIPGLHIVWICREKTLFDGVGGALERIEVPSFGGRAVAELVFAKRTSDATPEVEQRLSQLLEHVDQNTDPSLYAAVLQMMQAEAT